LFDVLLPFPKDLELVHSIARQAREAVSRRIELRGDIQSRVLELEGDDMALADEADLTDEPN
jgi:hypothetical protein